MFTSLAVRPRDSACSFNLLATPLALPVCEPYKIVNGAASPAAGAAATPPVNAPAFALAAK